MSVIKSYRVIRYIFYWDKYIYVYISVCVYVIFTHFKYKEFYGVYYKYVFEPYKYRFYLRAVELEFCKLKNTLRFF